MRNPKSVIASLSCIFIMLSLVGCSDEKGQSTEDKPQDSISSTASAETNAGDKLTQDVYREQIKYYMELAEALQNELLELKQQSYINEKEYTSKISKLEESIKKLTDAVNASNGLQGSSGSNSNTASPPAKGEEQVLPDSLTSKLTFKYSVTDGEITIIKYTGSDTSITVPSSIDDMPVTAIGEEAFKGSAVTCVVLPSSVKTIDWFAFADCTSLVRITIPSSVSSISYGAFEHCPQSLVVVCKKGSYAEAYTKSWGMCSVAE